MPLRTFPEFQKDIKRHLSIVAEEDREILLSSMYRLAEWKEAILEPAIRNAATKVTELEAADKNKSRDGAKLRKAQSRIAGAIQMMNEALELCPRELEEIRSSISASIASLEKGQEVITPRLLRFYSLAIGLGHKPFRSTFTDHCLIEALDLVLARYENARGKPLPKNALIREVFSAALGETWSVSRIKSARFQMRRAQGGPLTANLSDLQPLQD